MSGPAWNALKAQADLPAGTPDVSNQDQMNNVYVLAKALVHVRTGIESYRTEVRQNCMAAIDTELGGRTLALGRELAAYVIAADLVGLEASEDTTFRAWLRRCLTETLDGKTLQSTHEDRPNNWGTAAGASRAAVAVYLGDSAELARAAQVFKGWVGDRSSYAGFTYGDLSWQCDPAQPVGINPLGCVKQGESIDGALPEEMRRGCTFRFPPCHTGYVWTGMQGVTVQAEILHRAGYDAWNWQDQAIRRAFQFLYDLDQRYGGWWAVGNDEWNVWLANRVYGTSFPAVTPAGPGKIMAWNDWTHGPSLPTNITFHPTSGLVGAEVAIDGTSFASATAVAFNGTPGSFTLENHTRLRATVPVGATSGPISVTNQFGTATSADTFTVIVPITPPAISFFTPISGPAGTVVTVHGSGFGAATAVIFNGTPVDSFAAESDTLLRATVPATATSGPIGVTNPAGTATGTDTFTVIAPPTIAFFTPTSGPVGTEVAVHGASLSTATAVIFNGTPVDSFAAESDTLLRATVPLGASTGPIRVTNPAGTATSADTFTVIVPITPPAISFFTPISGPAGTVVTVHGSGFGAATAVTFNGTGADSFAAESDTLLRATVPLGASTGPIRVTNPAGTATSVDTFTVIAPPTIAAFDPASGPVGIEVTVQGTSLATATAVAFNGTAADSFTAESDTLLRAIVPAGATSGPIRVTNPAGTATSTDSFTVIAPPTIAFFAPTSGPVGTQVDVHGSGLMATTAVTFNNTAADSFTAESDTLLRAIVPAGASSGPIRVTNPAGTAASGIDFLVVMPPTIQSFAPDSGGVGTEVTVRGAGFTGTTAVEFTAAPATQFTVASDSLIQVTVPTGAGSGPIAVTNPAGSTSSTGSFTVIPPPRVGSFVPTGGPAGIEVTVRGNGFATATAVTFHHRPASFEIDSDWRLRALVPPGATTGPIRVTNRAGSASSADSFVVYAPPIITSFSPDSGAVGAEVAVQGSGFISAIAVAFNGTTAAFTADSDTLLHATVPSAASSGPISVTNSFGSDTTETSFIVTGFVAVDGEGIAGVFALGPSFPNPFRARAKVRLELPRPGEVRLTVYDLMGRVVRSLVDGHLPAGVHEVAWDALDKTGSPVESGLYWLRLEAQEFAATRRLLRMR